MGLGSQPMLWHINEKITIIVNASKDIPVLSKYQNRVDVTQNKLKLHIGIYNYSDKNWNLDSKSYL